MKDKTYFVVGILSLIGIFLLALFFTGSLSTILGEEGYNPYDVLLDNNNYNPNLWSFKTSGYPVPVDVKVVDKKLYSNVDFCTRNLYLEDFKTDYNSILRVNNWWEISNSVSVNGQKVELHKKLINTGYDYKSGTIQVLWDDYKNNHFNLLVDGVLKLDSTVDNEELIICFDSEDWDNTIGRDWEGSFEISNPRVKKIFGCDLKDGEVLVSKTFTSNFGINNLNGFDRFCVDEEAQFLNAGVITSTSGVYYDLASGNIVTVGDNQVYRIFYVAKLNDLRDYEVCEEGLFDIDDGCKVGFVTLDDDDNIVVDDLVDNEIDLEDNIVIGDDGTITWLNNYANMILSVGDKRVFSSFAPVYDGEIFSGQTVRYPKPLESDWIFEINDERITEGETITVNDFWDVTLNSVYAKVSYNEFLSRGWNYDELDDWQLDYEIKLNKPFITVKNVSEQNDYLIMRVQNDYDDLDMKVFNVYSFESVNSVVTETINVNINKGINDVKIPLRKDYVGNINLKTLFMIDLEGQNLIVSDEIKTFYNEEENTAELEDKTAIVGKVLAGVVIVIILLVLYYFLSNTR